MTQPPKRPVGSEPKLSSPAQPSMRRLSAQEADPPAKKEAPRRRPAPSPARKKKSKRPAAGGSGAGTPPAYAWLRRGFWSWALSSFFVMCFFALAAMLYFTSGLPSVRGLEQAARQPGITIKTEDGLTLASYGDVYGHYVPYEKIPKHLVRAVLATEDRRFFDHGGVDVLGIARAMFVNLKAGRVVQGGSTVTQQVAKNIFLTPDKHLKRKLQELMLAFWLEANFSKEQIMAIYLNRVYLGSGNYGIDAASRRYFDKPADEINLMEGAILTGLLKAPSRYSPLSSVDRAKDRAKQVLLNMVDAEYITQADADVALQSFKPPKLYREGDASGSRYFTDWLIDEIPQYIGKVQGDITVLSTLDTKMQTQAEDALKAVMDEHSEAKLAKQAALLSMTPDGAVRAMVGGRSYPQSQYNRATQALRQPGSVFKLFVYMAALEAGLSPDMVLEDKPLDIRVGNTQWQPTNYDGKFRGEVTMRQALTESLNTVAVQLSQMVGVGRVAEMARRLGLKDVRANPSIALGATDTTLIDLTTAYAHLANGGRGVKPYGIKAIYANDGKPLYERDESELWVVVRESVVRGMNYMLMNVPLQGTGTRAYIGRPMAGKTGTSSDFRDAWFIGYIPQLVTGVWVGNDDNTSMKKVTGGNLPAMIWNGFMSAASKDLPAEGLIGSDGNLGIESVLPWQQTTPQGAQPAADNVLDLFRGSEPASQPPAGAPRYDGWDTKPKPSAPTPQPAAPSGGAPLDNGFWDKLFGQ